MSGFSDAVSSWIDPDGLIGSQPNPPKWTTGNPLLETGIAVAMEVALFGRNADVEFIKKLMDAIGRCQTPEGSFNKNPGRTDQITHDDLKAVATASRISGAPYAKTLASLGKKTGWNLSNTGSSYFEGYAKPWDQAIYLMCAGDVASWELMLMLYGSIAVSGFSSGASGHRLTWLTSLALDKINPMLDRDFSLWRKCMRSRYGSVGMMMFEYYGGNSNALSHPYVKYGKLLPF